jgi:uncharacterized membrane protein YciS (DUF1049 family)
VEAVPEIRQGLTRVIITQGPLGRQLYEGRYTTQIATLFMFGAAALLSGLLAAAFWIRERGVTTLLWFAVTALAWAVAAFPWLHAAFLIISACRPVDRSRSKNRSHRLRYRTTSTRSSSCCSWPGR